MSDTDSNNNSSVCAGAKPHCGKSLLILDWSANTQQLRSSNLFYVADFRQHISIWAILRIHIKLSHCPISVDKEAYEYYSATSKTQFTWYFFKQREYTVSGTKKKMWSESLEPLN